MRTTMAVTTLSLGLWLTAGASVRPARGWSQQGQRLQYEIQVKMARLNNTHNAGLESGTVTLTLEEHEGRLRGIVKQGRTVHRDVPFSLEGCRRETMNEFSGARATLEAKKSQDIAQLVEIRVRHPKVAKCFLVGILTVDRTGSADQ